MKIFNYFLLLFYIQMPYKLVHKSNGKYMVKNIDKNQIKAKNTTKTKALKQIKLLEYLDHKKRN